jgi:lipoyl(octanoyl) transferase
MFFCRLKDPPGDSPDSLQSITLPQSMKKPMSAVPENSVWTSQGRSSAALEVYLLGTVDFDAAMFLQERLVDEIVGRDDRLGALIICEHPPIVTIGRDGRITDLPVDAGDFTSRMMEIRRVDRGGGTLVHAPGQIAAYPILPVERLGCGRVEFRNKLNDAILATAAEQRVTAHAIDNPLGTTCRCGQFSWVGASIRDGVSYHGLFLNVSPVMDTVRLVRSTIDRTKIASLSMQRMEPVPMHKVREALMRHLSDQFGYHETHPYTGHPLLKRTRRKVMQHA